MTHDLTHEDFENLGLQKIVYIRPVPADDVREQFRKNGADLELETDTVFAVHAANGQPLAMLDDRDAAFAAARQYNVEPVSVH